VGGNELIRPNLTQHSQRLATALTSKLVAVLHWHYVSGTGITNSISGNNEYIDTMYNDFSVIIFCICWLNLYMLNMEMRIN